MNTNKSLADAMRERAEFLNKYPNQREVGWGDPNNVIAALYEFADVIDSWSSEYRSKEETYEENQRRRWGNRHWTQPEPAPMTMEERIEYARRKNNT